MITSEQDAGIGPGLKAPSSTAAWISVAMTSVMLRRLAHSNTH